LPETALKMSLRSIGVDPAGEIVAVLVFVISSEAAASSEPKV